MKSQKKYQLYSIALSKVRGGGFTATDDLAKWRKNIEDGIIDRQSSANGTINS